MRQTRSVSRTFAARVATPVIAIALALGGAILLALGGAAAAQSGPARQPGTYNINEVVSAGHTFFGAASQDLASVIEYVFSRYGEPTAYIVGEEGSGAFFGGLRYGEGDLRMRSGAAEHVFWQGPSIGFDWGADGSRVMVLVYNMTAPAQIFDTYTATSGLAYMAGGVGVNFQTNRPPPGQQVIVQGVIRTGVGLRLGLNIGYIRYTPRPTWNPF
jgi:hypothetical protein